MTHKSYRSYHLIPPHGGYRSLKSYQTTEIIYDLTVEFCRRWVESPRLKEQMTSAARSSKQNIAEASQDSGTSKKTELKLLGVARGSLEELLQDYQDFLRQRSLPLWGKEDAKARKIRALAYRSNRSYKTYLGFLRNPETAANCLICLIHQANYLLDRQLKALEKDFLTKGGFTENLFKKRLQFRLKTRVTPHKT